MVIHDDIDLPLGRLRLRPSGGAGGHRGLESIIESWEPRISPGYGSGWEGPRRRRRWWDMCCPDSSRRNRNCCSR